MDAFERFAHDTIELFKILEEPQLKLVKEESECRQGGPESVLRISQSEAGWVGTQAAAMFGPRMPTRASSSKLGGSQKPSGEGASEDFLQNLSKREIGIH